jgi:hypothetical protein
MSVGVGRVGPGEDRVGGERVPRSADEAHRTHLLRWEQEQEIEHQLQR